MQVTPLIYVPVDKATGELTIERTCEMFVSTTQPEKHFTGPLPRPRIDILMPGTMK